MPTPNDGDLLRRFLAENSQPAFAELVHRHVHAVYSVALPKVGGDRQLAEDVTQLVFSALARKARLLTGRPALGGWLYRSTQLAAADLVRKERRRRQREQEAQTMHDLGQNETFPVDAAGLRVALAELMDALDDHERDAIWMRFFEHHSFEQIAERLRITESAARKRVERTLDKLHLLLDRRGLTSSTVALSTLLAQHGLQAAPATLAAQVSAGALASLSAGSGGLLLGLMQTATRQKLAALAVIALAELATYLALDNRAEARVAAGLEQDNRTLATLRTEIRELQQRPAPPPPAPTVVIAPPPPAPAAPVLDETLPRLRALNDIVNQGGLARRLSWESDALATTMANIAETLALSPPETAAVQAAAEKARREISDSALRGATVQRDPADPARLTITSPESTATRALFDGLLAALSGILGPDRYPLFQSLGAADSVEAMMRKSGLARRYHVIVAYPAPDQPTRYEVGSLQSIGPNLTEVNMDYLRMLGGGADSNVSSPANNPPPTTAVSRDELRVLIAPFDALLPDNF